MSRSFLTVRLFSLLTVVLVAATAFAAAPARPVQAASALPSDRLHFGLANGPDQLGWMTASGVPWRYRYTYLAGGLYNNPWPSWQDPAQPPGQYALDYMNNSWSNGYIPVFPYYMLLQSHRASDEATDDYNNLNNATLMRDYYANFTLLMKKAAQFGHQVVVHVEPDLWGYLQQRAGNGPPTSVSASVNGSGNVDVAAFTNNVQGFGQALLHLRDLYAPNVVMAVHASMWSSGRDLATDGDPALNAVTEADKTAAFLSATGNWDVVFNDVDDHDAGWWEAQGNTSHWWDKTNTRFPNFARYLSWVHELRVRTGKPQVAWQVPVGNQFYLTENNTPGHYQDNVAEYFLGHTADLYSAGLIAVLFGAGNPDQTTPYDTKQDGVTNNGGVPTTDSAGGCNACNTQTSIYPDDDGGYLRVFVGRYYAPPPTPPTPPTPTPGRHPAHNPLRHADISPPSSGQPGKPNGLASGSPAGYIPCDIRNAYHLATSVTGIDMTIAVVDYSDNPSMQSDLHAFDVDLGLPDPPSFRTVKLNSPSGGPPVDGAWTPEIAMDVEWAHAMAPAAGIVLIETSDLNVTTASNGYDMTAGIRTAVGSGVNADVVSMSWGASQFTASEMTSLDSNLPDTNSAGAPVAYVAAAGDTGFGIQWPAVSPKVVGVGGTSVTAAAFGYATRPAGSHYSCSPTQAPGVTSGNETVWGAPAQCTSSPAPGQPYCSGTGGGMSPDYPSTSNPRHMPDAAMDADTSSGVAIVSGGGWQSGWAGTSLGASIWSGIIASLDQGRLMNGRTRLTGTGWIYSASAGDFNDVVSGSSPAKPADPCMTTTNADQSCSAKPGYDLVTGRGSPNGSALMSDLGATPNYGTSGVCVLDGYGGLHRSVNGNLACAPQSAYWPGWDIARGVATFSDGSGGYVLDGYGGLHPFGLAQNVKPGGYWPGWDIARAVVLAPWATPADPEGWVLDGFGGIHGFGGAADIPAPGYWPNWDIARELIVGPSSTKSATWGYTIDGFGGLHAFGGAKTVTNGPYWPGWNIVRGAQLAANSTPNNPGGFILDGFGGVHGFGSAASPAVSGYWPNWDIARGLTMVPGSSTQGYVLDGFGGIHGFGGAGDLGSGGYWPNWDIAHSMGGAGQGSADGVPVP